MGRDTNNQHIMRFLCYFSLHITYLTYVQLLGSKGQKEKFTLLLANPDIIALKTKHRNVNAIKIKANLIVIALDFEVDNPPQPRHICI